MQYESSLFFTFFHFFYTPLIESERGYINYGLTYTPKLCKFQVGLRWLTNMLGFATLIESGVYSFLKGFDIRWYIDI